MFGQTHHAVIAESSTKEPLSGASIFDNKGNAIGITNNKGHLPYVSKSNYPITIRYLGFNECVVPEESTDTIFLVENATELPEVIVESKQHKFLHVLAYAREYSTLCTYSDTVFLFREKMVDFMLPPDSKEKFRGWRTPRLLKSNSYYRFTNSQGLDSVSNECRHHFSWSDWIGLIPSPTIPIKLRNVEVGSDTLKGKYRPTEIWVRDGDKLTIDVNVLADTTSRRWVPNLSGFFRNNLDFEDFRIRFSYKNVIGDSIAAIDTKGYSFYIESNGRGHDMFLFNHINEPFFVTTYAEVYILDKEFITKKDAKKWEKMDFDVSKIEMIEPPEAAKLQDSINTLIARVEAISHDTVRLNIKPDRRLIGRVAHRSHIGQRAWDLFKQVTGITSYRTRKNLNNNWNNFRKGQQQKNNSRPIDK